MELAIRILADYYAKHGYLEQMIDPTQIIQDRCYRALCRIKEIWEDETLEDPECFQKSRRLSVSWKNWEQMRESVMILDKKSPGDHSPGDCCLV